METMTTEPNELDEIERVAAAVERQRRTAIATIVAALGTFLLFAFLGEFLLAEPLDLGFVELERAHTYLIAPVMGLLAAAITFLRMRPKQAAFLPVEGDPEDPAVQADAAALSEAAGLKGGHRGLVANLAGFALFAIVWLAGSFGLEAYYEHLNEADYGFRRVRAPEHFALVVMGILLGGGLRWILAPKKKKTEKVALDDDTKALYGEVARNTRRVQLANLVGGALGILVAGAALYGVGLFYDERDLTLGIKELFGAILSGFLVGTFVRGLLLPASMQEAGELSVANLPAGDPKALMDELRADAATLSKRASLADYVPYFFRSPARYELACGGAMGVFVQEQSHPMARALLGPSRAMTLHVADVDARTLTLRKPLFSGTLVASSPSGAELATAKRSFFGTKVIVQSADAKVVIARSFWSRRRYFAKQSGAKLVEITTAKPGFLQPIRTELDIAPEATPETRLLALIGVLAMDAI